MFHSNDHLLHYLLTRCVYFERTLPDVCLYIHGGFTGVLVGSQIIYAAPPHLHAYTPSPAVGSLYLGHGFHRVPGPVPGGFGSVHLYKLPRTSETSDGESGGKRTAQRADGRDPQVARGASEGGSPSVRITTIRTEHIIALIFCTFNEVIRWAVTTGRDFQVNQTPFEKTTNLNTNVNRTRDTHFSEGNNHDQMLNVSEGLSHWPNCLWQHVPD